MNDFPKKYPFLNKKDALILDKAVNEIKRLKDIEGIVQMGSSTHSENYHDIDVMIFFDSFLVPPELDKIRDKYKESKLYLEGSSIYYKDFNVGFKVFIKFFSNMKHKKILYGKDPFANKKINLKKTDVAMYIWYQHHICEQYEKGYESAFPSSMNVILSYINIFPKDKEQTLIMFIKKFPSLARYLPKKPKEFLRGTNKSNFKKLYPFFENCLKYFTR